MNYIQIHFKDVMIETEIGYKLLMQNGKYVIANEIQDNDIIDGYGRVLLVEKSEESIVVREIILIQKVALWQWTSLIFATLMMIIIFIKFIKEML